MAFECSRARFKLLPHALSQINLPHSVARIELYQLVREKEGHATRKKGERTRRRKGGNEKKKQTIEVLKEIESSFAAHLLVASALLGNVALRALGLEDLLSAGEV